MTKPTPKDEEGNQNALQRVEAEGIDLSLLRERLKLSPTERLESHKQALISPRSLIGEVNRAWHRSHSEGTLGKKVDFVVIGGIAAVVHGSAYITQDFDLCYARSPLNLERLADALAPFHPRLRGAPFEAT